MKQAAAVARLACYSASTKDELATVSPHLQWILVPIVHPCILVLLSLFLEVRARICVVRPIALVALRSPLRLLSLRMHFAYSCIGGALFRAGPSHDFQSGLDMVWWLSQDNNCSWFPFMWLARLQLSLLHERPCCATEIHDETLPMLISQQCGMPTTMSFISLFSFRLLPRQYVKALVRHVNSTHVASVTLKGDHGRRRIWQ
mmetsp:Transcript_99548/g.172814  ORF Transcript_99548/g.172814 Transcript_99548/m.172814 type:complete len:202 (+) Transcript_99548:492-1097(+)